MMRAQIGEVAATVGETLDLGAGRLRAAGVDEPRRDARLLLALAAGAAHPAAMDLHAGLGSADLGRFAAFLGRRERREPVSRIVGRREFWGLEFALTAEVLDPRPDSETLIEAALSVYAGAAGPVRILDLGTGSGCLLCALLAEFPDAWGLGTDLAPATIAEARANAGRLGLGDRAHFAVADWGASLDGTFDLIVANPPYIAAGAVPGLMPEVRRYDPLLALAGGADGLDCMRALIPHARRLAGPDAVVVLETGLGQDAAVAAIAAGAGLGMRDRRRDLAGIVRCIVATPA